MRLLQVGQPFPDWKDWRHIDVTQYNYQYGTGHELLIMLHSPTPQEVEGIWHGPAAFGLFVSGPAIFLAFRFGQPKVFEGEAPYTIHALAEEARQLPDLDLAPDEGAALSVILVDSDSRLVNALRVLALTNRFSLALHRAIHLQAMTPWDGHKYHQEVNKVYQAFSSKDIWRMCSVTCRAGERDTDEKPDRKQLFPLGQVVATQGALAALETTDQSPIEFIGRHMAGDWGELDPFDIEQNNLAVAGGSRLLSAYRLSDGTKVWVITEWDRSATTILLPEEY